MNKLLHWMGALALCASHMAWAQSVPGVPQTTPPACPTAADMAAVAVTAVRNTQRPGNLVEPGDSIELTVRNLELLRARKDCAGGAKKIVLYLAGRPASTLEPLASSPQSSTLTFELKRDEQLRDLWAHLLGRPGFGAKEVAVSIGLADEFPVSPGTLRLVAIPLGDFWGWVAILVGILVTFSLLAVRSNMLRDAGPAPAAPAKKPFSLARVQAAFWFVLTVGAYAFIGLLTGDYQSSITGTVLGLMGISAGTTVGSALVDGDRPAAPRASRGLLRDIVGDGDEVNFHQFQMAAWTVVLGVVFVGDVYADLAMPDFGATLLGLMGISSGTYLGLRTATEKK